LSAINCSDSPGLALDTTVHTHNHKNGTLHRKSPRHHESHGRRHVEPQSTTPTPQALEDVLFASDQSIHARWRRDHRLRRGLSSLTISPATPDGLANMNEVRLKLRQTESRRPRRLDIRTDWRLMDGRQRPRAGMVLRQRDRRVERLECAHSQQQRRSGVFPRRGRGRAKSQHTDQGPAVESTTSARAQLLGLSHCTRWRSLCHAQRLGCCLTLTAPPWTRCVSTAIHAMLMHTPSTTTTFNDATMIILRCTHSFDYDYNEKP
jgi:hypothetical protein